MFFFRLLRASFSRVLLVVLLTLLAQLPAEAMAISRVALVIGNSAYAEDPLKNPSDVKYNTIDARRILGIMEDADNRLNIVILDACRNNPFRRFFRSRQQGLAIMDAPDGTIVAYATAPGSVALDGGGRNGLYTSHLLANLSRPGLSVLEFFNQTGLDVKQATRSRQTPWMTNSPMEPFFLAGGNPESVSDAGSGYAVSETGRLRVVSEPPGAELSIDGTAAGRTPVELSDLTPGTVGLRVTKPGYRPESRRATIRSGRRTVERFELRPEQRTGWLTVVPEPEDAKIRILNIRPSYRPGMDLDAGEYQVEVSASGYRTETRTIRLAAGDEVRVSVVLERERRRPAPQPSRPQPATVSGSSSRTVTDPTTGMEFVLVKGGCYQMGDTFGDGDDDEKPVHEVCVDDFYMGTYEVTQGEYQTVTGRNPSRFTKGKNYPVENVSWNDAREFITNLNRKSNRSYRLPTEAEWEYAARSGGKKEKYAGSNTPDSVAWHNGNSNSSTHPVGTRDPNGLGLYDMSGNVWEWCQDWYDSDYYGSSPRNNPQGPSSAAGRVIRGGCWSNLPRNLRAAFRYGFRPEGRNLILGFRLVLPVQR